MSGPLSGFKILDMSRVLAGPAATVLLADQGADVIKVEPLDGDVVRAMGGGGVTFFCLSIAIMQNNWHIIFNTEL